MFIKTKRPMSENKKDSPKANEIVSENHLIKGSVGFMYGGALKFSYVHFFHIPSQEHEEVTEYTKKKFTEYYGSDFSARYILCKNSEEIFDKIIQRTGAALVCGKVCKILALLKDVTETDKIKSLHFRNVEMDNDN